jgi:hypothetical protein
MAKEKNVIGKTGGKDDEAEQIFKRIEKEGISSRLAAAQVIGGGEGLTVDAPGTGRKNAHGVIKN